MEYTGHLEFVQTKIPFTLDALVKDIAAHVPQQEILLVRSRKIKQYAQLQEELSRRQIPYRVISVAEALAVTTRQNETVYYIYLPGIEIVEEKK
ncbi:hypothetical protein A2642_04500 [Candidatus Nomurabacteria bacterium RIFCSPHIGHO2_01_FULL_39_10]|uniref:Uncharacterized protein n=1 Tax=Candidatus Nomurabacteria bacterium RIFCSPHIGHO2_01_FULL_39_10 TaxID=1801733 RepID=A0A1F6V7W9_9BACT|nr:MAG: hypothetical protein A2642_04500 [Candidatus Nomurabacteria bacterium RIFCSPHIGHO2_01_FULL_39_10]